jgi:hypothetical protein
MAKITRKGSGRTKGSFSFVRIPLKDLTGKFADDTTPILVSRKWAEQVGFQGLTSAPASSTYDAIQGQTPATKVGATVSDLDA